MRESNIAFHHGLPKRRIKLNSLKPLSAYPLSGQILPRGNVGPQYDLPQRKHRWFEFVVINIHIQVFSFYQQMN